MRWTTPGSSSGVVKATAWGGRISLVGASSGYEAITPLSHVFYRQLSISIFGSTMASKSRLFPILRWVEQGQLQPVVGDALPLAQAAEAHRLLRAAGIWQGCTGGIKRFKASSLGWTRFW